MVCLKAREQYENEYDRIVIAWCRELEAAMKGTSYALLLYIKKVKYAERRQKCIAEWIRKDLERDEFENKNPAPNCRCHSCNTSMDLQYKFMENWRQGREKYRIIFFFGCPHCKKKRGIYDNGEEEEIVVKCERCSSQNVEISTKCRNNGAAQFLETCHDCHHIKKSILKAVRKEKVDPNYERYRKRFCMSQEEVDQLKFFLSNAETVFAKRQERFAKPQPISEKKTQPTMHHPDPLGSRYFDRI